MTLGEWLASARSVLERSGCPDPAIDASWMLEDGLELSRVQARLQRDRALTEAEEARLGEMLSRRASGEPVQYVTGRADFMGFRFFVDARVLIPRADTENLVEGAVAFLRDARKERPLQVLDLCAGSGAIGLSILKLCPFVRATLADVSPGALAVARQNAAALDVRAEFVEGDLFEPLAGRRFDLIACNPPYIPRGELPGLQREVLREPQLALDGGEDGLDFYRRVAREAPAHLERRGAIFLEVGAGQARQVRAMLQEALAGAETGIIDDLSGIERVVWARSC